MTIIKRVHFLAITAAVVLSGAHGAHAQGNAQRGDRAAIVFAAPSEIFMFISQQCE